MSRAVVTRGPRDCFRSERISAPCQVCGARPEVAHMPRGEGFFCPEHCPACAPGAKQAEGVR